MTDLPTWVYDVVMAREKWSDEHPKLYAELFNPDHNAYEMRRLTDSCGCEGLQLVPAEVRAHARVLSSYLDAVNRDKEPGPDAARSSSATVADYLEFAATGDVKRYPPTRCPRCGGPVDVALVSVTMGAYEDAISGRWSCRTPGCRPDEPVKFADQEGAG